MDYQLLLEELWAARVTIESLDLAAGSVVLEFTRTASGVTEAHFLKLAGVESFVFARSAEQEWESAEATEVGLFDKGDALEFGMVVWDEPNELTVVCREAWLDGRLIARRERG